ncbi:hypothetical protein BX666DRAFT_985338 [Dichotomocladium elegans]|nr:hypothetical protein BX666DRAFT_985338 [Dichotomocladium elegans]
MLNPFQAPFVPHTHPTTCPASQTSKDDEIAKKLKQMGEADMPFCFCGKPALLSETDLGPMYNCCRLGCDSLPASKYICGFHVHKRAWNYFRGKLLGGSDIDPDDCELSVCPYFNYTFCVMFGVINGYAKSFPPPPNCFCGLAVKMAAESDDFGNGQRDMCKLFFRCPHFDIEGAKPKCAFSLPAEQVAFRRPNRMLHTLDLPKMEAIFESLEKSK